MNNKLKSNTPTWDKFPIICTILFVILLGSIIGGELCIELWVIFYNNYFSKLAGIANGLYLIFCLISLSSYAFLWSFECIEIEI